MTESGPDEHVFDAVLAHRIHAAYAAAPAKPGHAARADEQLALLTV